MNTSECKTRSCNQCSWTFSVLMGFSAPTCIFLAKTTFQIAELDQKWVFFFVVNGWVILWILFNFLYAHIHWLKIKYNYSREWKKYLQYSFGFIFMFYPILAVIYQIEPSIYNYTSYKFLSICISFMSIPVLHAVLRIPPLYLK